MRWRHRWQWQRQERTATAWARFRIVKMVIATTLSVLTVFNSTVADDDEHQNREKEKERTSRQLTFTSSKHSNFHVHTSVSSAKLAMKRFVVSLLTVHKYELASPCALFLFLVCLRCNCYDSVAVPFNCNRRSFDFATSFDRFKRKRLNGIDNLVVSMTSLVVTVVLCRFVCRRALTAIFYEWKCSAQTNKSWCQDCHFDMTWSVWVKAWSMQYPWQVSQYLMFERWKRRKKKRKEGEKKRF